MCVLSVARLNLNPNLFRQLPRRWSLRLDITVMCDCSWCQGCASYHSYTTVNGAKKVVALECCMVVDCIRTPVNHCVETVCRPSHAMHKL